MPERDVSGFLHDQVPYLRLGHGPPLVSMLGLTPGHNVPQGFDRRLAHAHAAPLAQHFTVYVVNRKQGLDRGESMSDIAAHLANAIEHDIGEPVFLDGTSTGGSVALQLSLDRPDLVRRLVLVCSACRLGPHGLTVQTDLEQHLPRVTAPTLVIGGSRDVFYSEHLFRTTASGVADGRSHIFPGWGHARTSLATATTHPGARVPARRTPT